jgi:hypothetical protein
MLIENRNMILDQLIIVEYELSMKKCEGKKEIQYYMEEIFF